jgi:hypothetical protein
VAAADCLECFSTNLQKPTWISILNKYNLHFSTHFSTS